MAAMHRHVPRRGLRLRNLEFYLGAGVVISFIIGAVLFLLPARDSQADGTGLPRGRRTGTGAIVAGRAKDDSALSETRYLVMSSSSCEDIGRPKPWIFDSKANGVPPSAGGVYDVVLIDYSANNTCLQYVPPSSTVGGVSFTLLHMPRTFKWPAARAFFQSPEGLAALARYDYFFISDDDIDFHAGPAGLARLLGLCARAGFFICQPALSGRSAVNFAATAYAPPHDGSGLDEATMATAPLAYLRKSRFVEQMAPLFSRELLMGMLPFFANVTTAWGIDHLWSSTAERLGRPFGVVDSVLIDHMRPSGVSNLYKRVGGIDRARAEQEKFKERFAVLPAVVAAAEERGQGELVAIPNRLPWE